MKKIKKAEHNIAIGSIDWRQHSEGDTEGDRGI